MELRLKPFSEQIVVEVLPGQGGGIVIDGAITKNAADSIGRNGTITLRSGRDGDQVWISVTDTGIGISAEHLSKIFDPFFTTKPSGQGTGLGLSVSYGISNKHGGQIRVNSQPGQGATMTVWLPIKRVPEAIAP